MHLAICDDHIADRKQMERLLGRESDRRIPTTGVLYVDSFGSPNSLLSAPMIYDAIFMDITEDGNDAVELIHMLRADGTQIPIVLCCGKVDYRKNTTLPENVSFLDKPILVHELSAAVDELLLLVSQREKKLEFRNETETFYIKPDELLYAFPADDRHMQIHLFDGSDRLTEMTLANFCGNLSDYDCYIELISGTILNFLYIKEVSFFKVTMLDNSKFRLNFMEAKILLQAWEKYKANHPVH